MANHVGKTVGRLSGIGSIDWFFDVPIVAFLSEFSDGNEQLESLDFVRIDLRGGIHL